MNQNDLLRAISQGFQKTPKETLWEVIILISLILGIILFFIIYKALENRRFLKIWNSEFARIIRKRDLTINELDLVDKLSVYLINPKRKSLLLKNINTYFNALSQLQRDIGETSTYAESLEKKLFSTAELEEFNNHRGISESNKTIRLIRDNGKAYSGKLRSREQNKLVVSELQKIDFDEKPGFPRIYIQDFKGLTAYPFQKTEKTRTGDLAVIIDSSLKDSSRKYNLSIIYGFLTKEEPPLQARLIGLNKRYAILADSSRNLKKGQFLKLSLNSSRDKWMTNAVVLRTGPGKRKAIIQMGNLNNYN